MKKDIDLIGIIFIGLYIAQAEMQSPFFWLTHGLLWKFFMDNLDSALSSLRISYSLSLNDKLYLLIRELGWHRSGRPTHRDLSRYFYLALNISAKLAPTNAAPPCAQPPSTGIIAPLI